MNNHFPYELMKDRQDALERLDLRVYWGRYEIRVLRFHLTTFPPGKIVSFHKHAEYEFHFIPRGKERYYGRRALWVAGRHVLSNRSECASLSGGGCAEPMDELCLHVDIIPRDEVSDHESPALPPSDPWEMAEADDCMEKLRGLPLKPTMDIHRAMPYFLEAYQASQEKYSGLYTTIKQCIIQILSRCTRI